MGGIMRPTIALADMEATGADTGTGTTAIASTEVDATAEGMMLGASALAQGRTAVEEPQQATPRRRRRQLRPAGGQGTRPVGTRASAQGAAGAKPELCPDPPAQATILTVAGEAHNTAGQLHLLATYPRQTQE